MILSSSFFFFASFSSFRSLASIFFLHALFISFLTLPFFIFILSFFPRLYSSFLHSVFTSLYTYILLPFASSLSSFMSVYLISSFSWLSSTFLSYFLNSLFLFSPFVYYNAGLENAMLHRNAEFVLCHELATPSEQLNWPVACLPNSIVITQQLHNCSRKTLQYESWMFITVTTTVLYAVHWILPLITVIIIYYLLLLVGRYWVPRYLFKSLGIY
jgi:hypothetical protein